MKEKLAARYPEVLDYRADLARTLVNEINFLDQVQAENNMRRVREILDELTAQRPTNVLYQSDWASYHISLSSLREQAGQIDEAADACREAIRLMAKVVEKNPAKLEYQRHLARNHQTL